MKLESLKNDKFKDKVLKCELNTLFGGQSTEKTLSGTCKEGNCTDVSTTTIKEDGTRSVCKTYDCPTVASPTDSTAVK